jgi:hypothetical protein
LPFLDEVAILVPNEGHAASLVQRLVSEPGYEYFNTTKGVVHTYPFHTTYQVQYHFVRTPRNYRLEIMHLRYEEAGRAGFSPLHMAMWRPNGVPEKQDGTNAYPVVHVSYKLPNQEQYDAELEWLTRTGSVQGMSCRSEYGRFSYWLPHCAEMLLWLKPRVNLRDV